MTAFATLTRVNDSVEQLLQETRKERGRDGRERASPGSTNLLTWYFDSINLFAWAGWHRNLFIY